MPLVPRPGGALGTSLWKIEAMDRARSIDPDLNIIIDNEFDTNAESSTFISTSGTVTYDTGMTGGVARLKTGLVALGNAGVYNAGGSGIVGSPLGESWYVQSRAWIRNVPVGISVYYTVALQNDLTVNRHFISLVLDAAIDPTFLAIDMQIGTGGPRTTYLSNVAADTSAPHDYGIGRDVVNDKLYALVDGLPILEIDGPFGNLTTNPCFQYSAVSGDAAAQDIELWVDSVAAVVKRVG